ncbi:MAG: sigma-70 family RNA polymerase sigma factor, partial [Pseudomonadota bacterium]|nr:sigma-70 family RNA polymerase sigma factor [Pseudomonadota bacterium]
MDDLLVIEQVRQGNRRAFETLVRHHQGPLFQYLGRMGLASEEIEDLVQETFVRAFRHLHAFDPRRARFPTWLFTIAKRLALNLLARKRPVRDDLDTARLAGSALRPDEHCDAPLIKRRIDDALRQIPLKYRSPVALAYLKDMSLADIARVEGCSVGTVKSRIHRGKQRRSVAVLRMRNGTSQSPFRLPLGDSLYAPVRPAPGPQLRHFAP